VTVGYFSLFDLGLGRALTQLVAEKLGSSDQEEIPALVCTSLWLLSILGLLGAATMALLAPWFVHSVLRIPPSLHPETIRAFYVLSASVPIVVTTVALRGVLEAKQCFGAVSAIRVLMGVLMFAGPLLVLPFSTSLFPIAIVLLGSRFIVFIAHVWVCRRLKPSVVTAVGIRMSLVPQLMRFGTWMTVSNLISPLLVYLDRFLIGAMVSVAAVAYYATPYEVITKFLVIPGAITGVLFPAFSMSYSKNPATNIALLERGTKYIYMALFPVTLLSVVFAREGLAFWLGIEYAKNGARVMQWLSVGVFMNALAYVPFAQVQGAGRPDLTAKLHLIEFPLYLLTLWELVRIYGITGAAVAWTLRVGVDAALLFAMSSYILPLGRPVISRIALVLLTGLGVFAFAALCPGIVLKVTFSTLFLLAFPVTCWFIVLSPRERAFLVTLGKPSEVLD
jgi:O-antigen/teichoic acid export membrane protein